MRLSLLAVWALVFGCAGYAAGHDDNHNQEIDLQAHRRGLFEEQDRIYNRLQQEVDPAVFGQIMTLQTHTYSIGWYDQYLLPCYLAWERVLLDNPHIRDWHTNSKRMMHQAWTERRNEDTVVVNHIRSELAAMGLPQMDQIENYLSVWEQIVRLDARPEGQGE